MNHPVCGEAAHGRSRDMPCRGNQVRLIIAGEVVTRVVNGARNRNNPPVLENTVVIYDETCELDEEVGKRRPALPDAMPWRSTGGAISRRDSGRDLGAVRFYQTAVGRKCGQT